MRHVPLTTLFLTLLLAHGFLSPLQAKELINVNGMYYVSSGKYYVGEDKNGVYLRTDQDTFWYLDGDDLGAFKPGESGIYYLEKDTNKPYILTDKKLNRIVASNISIYFISFPFLFGRFL